MSHPYSVVPDFQYGKDRGKNHSWLGVVLHWSAGHSFAESTVKYINRPKSGGWYNYVMDKHTTFQTVDPLYKTAGHAGKDWNTKTIGVCIAQPVVYLPGALKIGTTAYMFQMEKLHKKLKDNGYEVDIVNYNSAQYPFVFTLDKELADATSDLTDFLCKQHSIPRVVVGTQNKGVISLDMRYKERRIGVCHHHHLTPRKFDCDPWLDQLNPALANRGFTILE
jgi:hypothetical protein